MLSKNISERPNISKYTVAAGAWDVIRITVGYGLGLPTYNHLRDSYGHDQHHAGSLDFNLWRP